MDVIWWVTAVIGAIAINLIASELFAWGPRCSECLTRCAVRRLAPEMQDRMQEEWAGHLETIPRGLWRIVAAAGFFLATRQINVALRVRERQEKADESKEKLEEKTHRAADDFAEIGARVQEFRTIEDFNVDIKFSVGSGKSVLMSKYVNDYSKIIEEDCIEKHNKDWFDGPYSSDKPERSSKTTPPKR